MGAIRLGWWLAICQKGSFDNQAKVEPIIWQDEAVRREAVRIAQVIRAGKLAFQFIEGGLNSFFHPVTSSAPIVVVVGQHRQSSSLFSRGVGL